jgi:hypothetical protein
MKKTNVKEKANEGDRKIQAGIQRANKRGK